MNRDQWNNLGLSTQQEFIKRYNNGPSIPIAPIGPAAREKRQGTANSMETVAGAQRSALTPAGQKLAEFLKPLDKFAFLKNEGPAQEAFSAGLMDASTLGAATPLTNAFKVPNALEISKQKNPTAATIGEIAGYLVPGSLAEHGAMAGARAVPAIAKLLTGTTAEQALAHAMTGAASGATVTAADDLINQKPADELWLDTLIGTLAGTLMNAGMFGGSKVLGALKKALSKGRGATAADIATAVDEAAVGNEAQAGNPLDNGKPEGYAGAETMPKYPGNNPAQVPAEGYEWRGNGVPGSKQGNWYNPSTKEWLRPDLNHPGPIAPHWDYGAPDGKTYRIFPDGTFEVK